jgi:DNA-binding MarR family transcriptional regulator
MAKPKSTSGVAVVAPPGPSGSEIGEPAARVLRRFRLVFNAFKTHFQQVEKKAGVGGAQLWALSIIRESAGIGVNDLARAMDVHQSTASNLVKALIERDLVVAAKDGLDRRAVQLRVSAAGGRVLKRAPGPFTGVLPQAGTAGQGSGRTDHGAGCRRARRKHSTRSDLKRSPAAEYSVAPAPYCFG